ncbi:hypothetical protein [Poseidonocella sp. HB161398]|uniref:hypothetical protein n=1 Tax=Poseidonocella sp. HB161398 TaxID=2320855 RepID=UPI001108A680|nr:hypothetical protein [Poseidonocella sp. HB161398]
MPQSIIGGALAQLARHLQPLLCHRAGNRRARRNRPVAERIAAKGMTWPRAVAVASPPKRHASHGQIGRRPAQAAVPRLFLAAAGPAGV